MQFSQDKHFWLIELLAWWEGGVNTRPLMRYFGQTRQSASAQIKRYLNDFPDSLDYHLQRKVYEPTRLFKPRYISGDVSEYLNWITGIAPPVVDYPLSHDRVSHPPRHISPELVRPLVTAIRENRRLDVEYLSVSSADTEGRIIIPHTLINTGMRWHVRAYCERSSDYRDFVLSRFRGAPDLMDTSHHTAVDDINWNTQITLVIEPDPRLSQNKRHIIEQDYLMQNGQLRFTTRAALAQYTLHAMQVKTKMLDGNPEAQQLVLVNLDEVKAWLF